MAVFSWRYRGKLRNNSIVSVPSATFAWHPRNTNQKHYRLNQFTRCLFPVFWQCYYQWIMLVWTTVSSLVAAGNIYQATVSNNSELARSQAGCSFFRLCNPFVANSLFVYAQTFQLYSRNISSFLCEQSGAHLINNRERRQNSKRNKFFVECRTSVWKLWRWHNVFISGQFIFILVSSE